MHKPLRSAKKMRVEPDELCGWIARDDAAHGLRLTKHAPEITSIPNMDWKTFITDPQTQKPFRGAITRIARKLRTHFGTVRKMYYGTLLPTTAESRKLQDIVHSRTIFAKKKRSDFGKKRAKYRKRLAVKSCAAAPQLNTLQSAEKPARKINLKKSCAPKIPR